MKNKLGPYINNLMTTIGNTEEKGYLRQLAIDELTKLQDDISAFIFQYLDEIENLPDFDSSHSDDVQKQYLEHWTCGVCGEHTNEVDYDYLSGTDHLECALKQENIQLELNFGDKNENK